LLDLGRSVGPRERKLLEHLRRMARYNRWANQRLQAACRALPEVEYRKPRQAFFGSLHGTLNHILVGDRLWLARLEGQPLPALELDDQPCADLAELEAARAAEDARMVRLVDAYRTDELDRIISYRRVTRPEQASTPLHLCWLHLFNHQTHHRGQAHDQLSQTGVPPPSLDLIEYLRESR
jgi:uncharacterized damage-inducible protein DinB